MANTQLGVPQLFLARGLKRVSQKSADQVSSVGAHGRAPYKPLIKQGVGAHSRAPLQALIKVGFCETL